MENGTRDDRGDGPLLTPVFDFGLRPAESASTRTAPGERTRADRRRAAAIDRVSVARTTAVVAVVAVLALGGAFAAWSLVQSSEAAVAAETAPFCASLAETPGVLSQPAFGWPTAVADLPTTVLLMQDYQERWSQLAAVAHPTIAADVAAISAAAGTVASGVESTKTIDRQGNLARMSSVTSASVIPAWVSKYCE
jgi:hypothetical protein